MPARKTKSGARKPPKKTASPAPKAGKQTQGARTTGSASKKAPKRKATKSTARGKAPKAKATARKATPRTGRKTSGSRPTGQKPTAKRPKKAEAPSKPTRKSPAKAPAKAKKAPGGKMAKRKTAPARDAKRTAAGKSAKKAAPKTKAVTKPAAPTRAKPTKVRKSTKATKAAAPAPPEEKPSEPKRGKKAPPSFVPPVTPVVKPLKSGGSARGRAAAPPVERAKSGHVDAQLVSAVHYGLFAAINKTFGRFGESMVKNAALRFLEYGYKKTWLPPSAKDPVRALNEFLSRLESMGYAERLHVGKKGDTHVCEVDGLSDWDAVHELKELHYPLLPVFLPEIVHAFLDQYFNLVVAMGETELVPEKQGLRIPFTMHERQVKQAALTNLPERPASAYYDLNE